MQWNNHITWGAAWLTTSERWNCAVWAQAPEEPSRASSSPLPPHGPGTRAPAVGTCEVQQSLMMVMIKVWSLPAQSIPWFYGFDNCLHLSNRSYFITKSRLRSGNSGYKHSRRGEGAVCPSREVSLWELCVLWLPQANSAARGARCAGHDVAVLNSNRKTFKEASSVSFGTLHSAAPSPWQTAYQPKLWIK